MDIKSDVVYDGRVIGQASIGSEGLYCCIQCRCSRPGSSMYRLKLNSADREIDLGICIPEGEHLLLKKRIPSKQLGSGDYRFQLQDQNRTADMKFFPVTENTPFDRISQLQNARWHTDGVVQGVIIAAGKL